MLQWENLGLEFIILKNNCCLQDMHMPKIKTKSAVKKRFKKLKSGLIKRAKAYRRHLLAKKTRNTKRNLRKISYVSSVDYRHIAPLLPR
jgi:large subunit ribosomal protein L35